MCTLYEKKIVWFSCTEYNSSFVPHVVDYLSAWFDFFYGESGGGPYYDVELIFDLESKVLQESKSVDLRVGSRSRKSIVNLIRLRDGSQWVGAYFHLFQSRVTSKLGRQNLGQKGCPTVI